ncbi:MAG: LUD domain-containing protein [Dehalococcoidia bacterium]
MSEIPPFSVRKAAALGDTQLRDNLLTFQRAWRVTRDAAFGSLAADGQEDFDRARRRLVAAKNAVLADPAEARRTFVAAATAAGATIHEAATAEDATGKICQLLLDRRVRLLAKGKSMAAEEIFLNDVLETAGIEVVETDLGEWIIQLSGETPSHMVIPAIHKNRHQTASLFAKTTGENVPPDDIGAQVALARRVLRRAFLSAGAGLIGANALIAETGSVLLVTNEGNGDLVTTLPPILIVLAGWEKLIPTLADASAQLRLLARSGTGQPITSYTTLITGAEPGQELHLVLLDNGRSAMWSDPVAWEALRCIRCAACADVCPPYQVVGGQVFGHVYSGAIGLVNTRFHHGLDAAAGPQSLCVSCNACATVCPTEIPLPTQILATRAAMVSERGLAAPARVGLAVWSRPRLFDVLARLAALVSQPLRPGWVRRLLPPAQRWRTPPLPARRPARDRLVGRTITPAQYAPWATSSVRGKTVALFLQCLADRFAPEVVFDTVRVLRACGLRVVTPSGQHCCGLPAFDAGDRTTARAMARTTIAGLEQVTADYVITAGTSCALFLEHDLELLFDGEPDWQTRAARLAARTFDLVTFLRQVVDPPALAPGGSLVAWQGFCQATNRAGAVGAGAELLRRAGYQLAPLAEAEVCCGFGGSTSLIHPEVARAIADRKRENIRQSGASTLVTDNPGCLLHLRGSADAAGDSYQVAHLATLLADRLTRRVRAI